MIRSTRNKPGKLIYEENILPGENVELAPEAIDLILRLFGEDLLEKCGHLPEGFDGSTS
jgi:hypothetical protein